MHDLALTGYHDDAGRQIRDRNGYLIKSHLYWPGMDIAIELKVPNCHICICRKHNRGAPLGLFTATKLNR